MKKWIQFNITYPRIVLAIIILVTIITGLGLRKLEFDNSTDALMPKYDYSYQMLERVEQIFGDNKAFIISSIEGDEKHELFSVPVFKKIQSLVEEIEEYKKFNPVLEDARMQKIMRISHVSVLREDTKKITKAAKIDVEDIDDIEAQLDAEILENKPPPAKEVIPSDTEKDILDLQIPLPGDRYAKPSRNRKKYKYDNYKEISIDEIKSVLDPVAKRQVDTILLTKGLEKKTNQKLSKAEFEMFFEAWEDLYLYKSLEIIERKMDPITLEDIQGRIEKGEKILDPVDLISEDNNGRRILPKTEKDFQKYKNNILKNPTFAYLAYAPGKDKSIRALGLSVNLRAQARHDKFAKYYWNIVNKYNRPPLKMYTLGSIIFTKFMTEFNQNDLQKFLPLVILIIILTFYFNFRSIRGVLLPLLSVLLATEWTMGVMGFLGLKMTLVTALLPPLLIAIGSSYSIHIFNQYMLDLPLIHKEGKTKGLVGAMTHISTTVFLAGFTTFVSFLTLAVNRVTALNEFGFLAALGTAFSVVTSVMLIPSVLMLMKNLPLKNKNPSEKDKGTSNKLVHSFISLLSKISIRYSRYVVGFMLLSILLGIFGASKIVIETAPTSFFKKDSYIRKTDKYISEVFNGSWILNIVFDSGKKNGAKEPDFLQFVENLRYWLSEPEQVNSHILHHIGFSDFIKRMNMAMHTDDVKQFVIPNNYTTIDDYLAIFNGEDRDQDARIDSLESTVDREYRRTNLIIKMGQKDGVLFGTRVAANIRKKILDHLNSLPNPNGYSWHVVGEPVNFVVLANYITTGQILSLILSTLIVGLVIFLLFKNIQAGAVALIPLSVTVLIIFGIMGMANIPLDIAKSILASVAIGIGVDDTIHFLQTLRSQLKSGYSLEEAMQRTFTISGLAIIYTSIALICGFSVLMLSSFGVIFDFGFLIATVMIATTLSALVFLPSFIIAFKIDINNEMKLKWLNYFFQRRNKNNK